jgi:hypothetical protein
MEAKLQVVCTVKMSESVGPPAERRKLNVFVGSCHGTSIIEAEMKLI